MPINRLSGQNQDGVALAILVWFLAAMSLLVAGMVLQARVDVKLAQLHVTRAQIEAAADGAMQLALAQLMQPVPVGEDPVPVMQSQSYSLGGYDITVVFTPVSGLININSAPEGLLVLLFSAVEDLDESAAHELALNVVEWRSADPFSEGVLEQPAQRTGSDNGSDTDATEPVDARHARFEAIEDLLLVAGIDRRVYESVQDAVYVSQEEQSGVDWASAPVPVLRAIGGLDEEAALELAALRMDDSEEGLVAPADLDLSFQEAAALSSYRIDALVQQEGSVFNRRRWVNRAQAGSDGLPWSFFRTEALRVLPSTTAESLILGASSHAGS